MMDFAIFIDFLCHKHPQNIKTHFELQTTIMTFGKKIMIFQYKPWL